MQMCQRHDALLPDLVQGPEHSPNLDVSSGSERRSTRSPVIRMLSPKLSAGTKARQSLWLSAR